MARTRSGDADLVLGPVAKPQTITGVVFCHAYSHTTTTMCSPRGGRPNAWALMQAIGSRFPTVVADQGGDNWGNDTAITAVGGCVSFLQGASSPVRAKAGKVLLVGVSMGFAAACAWARVNLSSVAAIAGIVSAADLNDLYVNNRGGSSVAALDAAYGGAYSEATYGPTHNPIHFAASLNVPIKLWGGADDTMATPAVQAAFAAAAPNCTVQSLGNIGGHDTEAAYPAALARGLLAFLDANA